MKTSHLILNSDARDLSSLTSGSVQLVVTSPPYPMIEMWDEMFISQSPEIRPAIDSFDGDSAFELMHLELDKVWREMYRVLSDGSFACINIGDAVRTLSGRFQLFSNHSRITQACKSIGFDILPVIIWKKTTNAPNKFMGSGMLPAGAYVTLEHEYILIFRKGGKRIFAATEDKELRNESALFWEERNKWFSDIWDLSGVTQKISDGKSRQRNAAYTLELPYRLINMYSLMGETVIDPFVGTGTTSIASMALARNSIGVEIDKEMVSLIATKINICKDTINQKVSDRLSSHDCFVREHIANKGEFKYVNSNYGFPVKTRQEKEILFYAVDNILQNDDESEFIAEHSPISPDSRILLSQTLF